MTPVISRPNQRTAEQTAEDDYDDLKAALRADLREVGTCVGICTIHAFVMAILLLALAVDWSFAISTAAATGMYKLFQVSDGRDYFHRTAERLKAHLRTSS